MRIEKGVVEEEINTNEDLVLTQNTIFKKNIICHNIISEGKKWNIDAVNINVWDINARDINAVNINAGNINAGNISAGNINAWDVDAMDINAGNINAGNINAGSINAGNINAGNINAEQIICISRKKKNPENKTIAHSFIDNRYEREKKEW